MEAECEDDLDEDDSTKHAPHSETTPLFKINSKEDPHDGEYFKQTIHPSMPDII